MPLSEVAPAPAADDELCACDEGVRSCVPGLDEGDVDELVDGLVGDVPDADASGIRSVISLSPPPVAVTRTEMLTLADGLRLNVTELSVLLKNSDVS